MTLSIDVKINEKYEIFLNNGQKIDVSLEEYINRMQNWHGEILINSIDKDGTLEGYDLELLKLIKKITDVPVICLAVLELNIFPAVSVTVDAVQLIIYIILLKIAL